MKKGLFTKIALAIIGISLLIGIAVPTFSQAPLVEVQTRLLTSQSAFQKFDGVKLYRSAYEAVKELHIKLDSQEALAAFSKEWEHKFDKTGELSTEEGTDKAIAAMLESLGQRFDFFLDKEGTKQEREQVDSQLSGIGATLRLSNAAEIIKKLPKDVKKDDFQKAMAISQENALTIEETIEGSPAEKSGLLASDVIRAVDGKNLNGMQMEDAVKIIKGKAGSSVKLSIERSVDGKLSSMDVNVVRGEVKIPVVKTKDLGNGMSYVKLNNFMSRHSVPEFLAALKKAAGGKGLVLDLRGNPGGNLQYVLAMMPMLLEDGPVMVERKRHGDEIIESEILLSKYLVFRLAPSESDPGKPQVNLGGRGPVVIPTGMPIVVLINEGSASASEILSGALQHNKRAVIVGKPSIGKGVGQTVVPLPFGRSLHITSFEFVPGRTPNDWYGVIPDQIVERGEDPKVDTQLEAAKTTLSGMIKSAEEMQNKREENFRKHQDEFKKQLELRQNKD